MIVDLNCDMGELEDAQHEAALMQYITSANIACGGHAGDEATMERTARLALERGVLLRPIGRTVYFADLGDHRTYGLGISTGRVLFQQDTGSFDPAISDGERIYLTGTTGLYALAPG